MSNQLNSRILKVIGIFSGAEAIKIICTIIKTKIVALWLGATGIGLFGIFANAIDTISILTGLGIRQSGVREVAKKRNSLGKLSEISAHIRSWVLLSGVVGALLLSFFSPILSLWFFGTYSHWWQFMIVSGMILLQSLSDGEMAIMQGTDRFRHIARSTTLGSFVGLAISIPLFRWVDESMSIPLSFIAYGVSVAAALWFNRDRRISTRIVSSHELKESSSMVKLGGYIALATFATNLAHMIFLSWLNRESSTATVGFYQAGNTLVVRYASIIFSAVGMEFYPRMSANSHSNHRTSIFVSHEIGLLLKIFTPMIIVFIIARSLIVKILYTSDFLIILPFITIAAGAIILRTISSCMAFTIIARGDGKTFLLTESIDAAIGVFLNIILFRHMGFAGLGLAQVLWYAIYTLMISIVYFGIYRLKLSGKATRGIVISSIICATVITIYTFL